jgi:hypothetical protein
MLEMTFVITYALKLIVVETGRPLKSTWSERKSTHVLVIGYVNTKIVYAFVIRKKADRSFGKNKILVLTEKKSMFILCNNDGN